MNSYNFNPGQKVLVRRNLEKPDVWGLAILGTPDNFNSESVDVDYDIIPFEGNEHLLWTIKDAGKQRWRATGNVLLLCIFNYGIVKCAYPKIIHRF